MSKLSLKYWMIAVLALVVPLSVSANDEVRALIDNPNYWAFPGGDYNNWRYTELKQINNKNAGNIVTAWTFSTGRLQGHEGGPLVLPPSATGLASDHLFIHSSFPNDVFAINLDDLTITWAYEPQQNEAETVPVMCCDIVNRGLGYSMGQIYLQQADTKLVALDAKTGKANWTAHNGGDIPASLGGPYTPKQGQTNTHAPHPVKDKVMVGCSGAEFGVRCWFAAYNAKDGSLAWRAFSMGPDKDMLFDKNTTSLGKKVGKNSSLKSWKGDQWKQGGGSVWGWWPVDFEENLVYYGNGNPGTWNPVVRPGDNKWSMTMFARDIDTGIAKWVYQMTPHDEWDYDGINEMILADLEVGGKMRKTLVHFDRNGFGYTLDRVSGELLVAEKFDPAVNWATHIDMKTGRPNVLPQYSTEHQGEDVNTTNICPAALGSKDQQPAAFSPKTKLFYVPTNHVCMDYEPFKVSYTAGQPYVGATLSMYPPKGESHMGNFIAWDASSGKIVWSNQERFSVWSGALATAGDVVFYGTLEGYLKAVDSKTGQELYKFKTPSGIIGNVMTYQHGGKQYVGVLSGIGGWAGIGLAAGLTDPQAGLGAVGGYAALHNYTRLGGQLTVFAVP